MSQTYVDMQGREIKPGDVLSIGIEDDDMHTLWHELTVRYCDVHQRLETPWGDDRHFGLGGFALDDEVQGVVAPKRRWFMMTEHVECKCGVWRIADDTLPCWNKSDRKQLMSEAWLQLNQAIRNLGYQLLKAIRIVR
jgi:hypothetical protein